jgi:uncharacterized protein YegL
MQNVTQNLSQMIDGVNQATGFGETPRFNVKTAGEINPEKRVPMVLVTDTSGSTAGDPINQLNDGLSTLKAEIMNDDQALLSMDLAIVEFNDSANVVRPFSNVDEAPMPILTSGGLTAMGAGLNLGIDLTEQRKYFYKQQGIPNWCPIMILLTDGAPNDDWQTAAYRLQQLEREGKINFFAVGYNGADISALQQLSCKNAPAMLQGIKFKEFFIWVSELASVVSRSTPEATALPSMPSPDQWMQNFVVQ